MAKLPKAEDFKRLKDALLGKKYELSLAYVDTRTARRLNRLYRGKDYPANVLAFPLSRASGEILLCPAVAGPLRRGEDEASSNARRLVIHAILHLAGYRHGAIMEAKERYYDKKYFSRNRRRHPQHAGGSRRIR